MTTALAAIFVFFLIVLVHELGHFIVAKLVGVKVHEFAIGMGPKLLQFGRGETKYSLRVLPIGGYVKMEGEDDESRAEGSINNKPVLSRIFVFASGAIMNFALAIVIFIVLALLNGSPTTEIGDIDKDSPSYLAGIREGDIIKAINGESINVWDEFSTKIIQSNTNSYTITTLRENEEIKFVVIPQQRRIIGIVPKFNNDDEPLTTISEVTKDAPAYEAGIRPGDKVIEINGHRINVWQDVINTISSSEEERIVIKVLRDEQNMEFIVKPVTQQLLVYDQKILGVDAKYTDSIFYGVSYGVKRIIFTIDEMFGFLGRVVRFENVSDELGGPVRIISIVGEVARHGFLDLLQLAAFLSVNLGFLNLLPIPALDGGRILFGVVELIRGKQMDPEKEGMIHFIGFVVLILLILVVTFNDVKQLFL